jgi:hypothetical protein
MGVGGRGLGAELLHGGLGDLQRTTHALVLTIQVRDQ